MLSVYKGEVSKKSVYNGDSRVQSRREANQLLQGLRVSLAAFVVVSHLYIGLIDDVLFLGRLAVNGFFVMSGWLAYTSLNRSWEFIQRKQQDAEGAIDQIREAAIIPSTSTPITTANASDSSLKEIVDVERRDTPIHLTPHRVTTGPEKEGSNSRVETVQRIRHLRKYALHILEYQIRRVPPVIWIMSILVIAMRCTDTFSSYVNLKENLFSFYKSPIFNFWTIHLRSMDTGRRVFWANPPVWYISCLTLFWLLAPFTYHGIRLFKKIPLGNLQVKLVVYAALPFVLMGLDYLYVYFRLDPKILKMPSPHPDPEVFAVQVSPEGYIGKYMIPMIANALWTELDFVLKGLESSAFPLITVVLSYFPLIDCLIIGQFLIWFATPKIPRSTYWTAVHASVFFPLHCILCWAAVNNIGADFLLSRLLRSRWMYKVAPDYTTLFIYLLHVPVTEIINHKPRILKGALVGLFILYNICLFASRLHDVVMKRYCGLTARLLRYYE